MHLLGRDMRLVATTPEGEAHDLIWIKDWDFNGRMPITIKYPLFLPTGTTIELVAHFDNSAENPANPNTPTGSSGLGRKNNR